VPITKTIDLDPAATSLLIDSGVLPREPAPIPVQQALSAIGDPESVVDLAQRLVTTVAMLWSDVAIADLFLPSGPAGELRGIADPAASHALLSAVGVAQSGGTDVRIIPSRPHLAAGDVGLGFGATMSVPIDGAETWAGFLVVQRRASAPEFTTRDLDGLTALARGLGPILTHVQAHVHGHHAHGAHAASRFSEHDMASAREMQRMFLPRPLESNSAGVRVLAEYMPAFAVGGDFYDFIDLGDGRLLAAIGDVSGKGVTAALMMSRISSELRRLAAEAVGPGEILARLNTSLPGRMQDDRFVTVVCVLLDMPKRRWVVANAGHVVPLLRRRTGSVMGLAYASGPPIGMMPQASFDEEVFAVEPGDILLLATDGVFELFAGHRRPCSTMGQCRLADVVEGAAHDLADIHKRILSAVEHSAHGRDDVALLGLELPTI
jgi:serine phosphatase RsbU (regulator of sigma subunit)